MPNRISTTELEDLKIEELRRELRFIRAGQIRLTAGGGACEGPLDEVTPCVLYAEIVEGRVMKFGTTDSLVSRQTAKRKNDQQHPRVSGRAESQQEQEDYRPQDLRQIQEAGAHGHPRRKGDRSLGNVPFGARSVSRRFEAVQCPVRCVPIGRALP